MEEVAEELSDPGEKTKEPNTDILGLRGRLSNFSQIEVNYDRFFLYNMYVRVTQKFQKDPVSLEELRNREFKKPRRVTPRTASIKK